MRHKRLKIIEFLAQSHKDTVYLTTNSGMSVLHIAAEAGYLEIVKKLIDVGFNVD